MNSHYLTLLKVVILYLLSASQLFAQNESCYDAFEICDYGNYQFTSLSTNGHLENYQSNNSDFKETNSIWIKWRSQSAGDIKFVILPHEYEDDFDFILYETEASCEELLPIRESMKGPSMDKKQDSSWKGDTGLSYDSNDIYESKGTDGSKDNFLKSIKSKPNRSYYLLVNNFNSNNGFNFYLEGNTTLSELDKCNTEQVDKLYVAVPNPASEVIFIKEINQPNNILNLNIGLYNYLGEKIQSTKLVDNELDIRRLSPGIYYVQLFEGSEYTTVLRFVKS